MLSRTAVSSPTAARSSLSKALSLLAAVAERGTAGLALSAAARRTDLNTATAHRLLNALVDENFVSFDPYSKRYHLGLMPYELVARAGPDAAFLELRRKLRPVLHPMQAETDGIVCVSVPSRGEALCIDVLPGRCEISINTLKIGARRPLGVGAASLALLASMPEDERERIIVAEAERYAKYGRMSAQIAREAAGRLGHDGYVFNAAYVIPDIGAMAIPLFANGVPVAAVSVTNTISRLGKKRRREIAASMAAAAHMAGFSTAREG